MNMQFGDVTEKILSFLLVPNKWRFVTCEVGFIVTIFRAEISPNFGIIWNIKKQIIAFDELKTDYKNPIDQCNSLNPLVLPEYIIHIFFNVLFLLAGQLGTVALNLPLIGYHIYRYANRPVMSQAGLYDPTTIMNADVLSRCMREGWIKLAFYLLSFFYYLYSMIYVLVSS